MRPPVGPASSWPAEITHKINLLSRAPNAGVPHHWGNVRLNSLNSLRDLKLPQSSEGAPYRLHKGRDTRIALSAPLLCTGVCAA